MSAAATIYSNSIAAGSWIDYFRGLDERGKNCGTDGQRGRGPSDPAKRLFEGLFLRIAERAAAAEQSGLGAEVSTQHEHLHRGTRRGCPRGAADHHARGKTGRGDAVPGRGQAGGSVREFRGVDGRFEAPDRQLLSEIGRA